MRLIWSGTKCSVSVISSLVPLCIPKQEVEHGKLMCGTENGMGGIPWLMEFSSVNDSDTFWDTDDVNFGLALPCTLENFQQFDQFFSKFIAIAREFLLPPERNRFGLITERSLLSSIGIGDSGSWSVMLHSAGCPTCSKIVKEADEVKGALQMDNSIVAEVSLFFLLIKISFFLETVWGFFRVCSLVPRSDIRLKPYHLSC